MKLKEFVDNLHKILKEKPEYENLEVVSAKDDEGNGYNSVYYEPALGHYDGDAFYSEQEILEDECCESDDVTHILVN